MKTSKQTDLALLTKATKEDLEEAVVDEYGVKYSKDGKRLLCGEIKGRYAVREGTEVICSGALVGCDKTRVHVPSSVTHIGEHAFWKCGYIDVDENNAKYASVDGVLYSKNKRVLVQYPNRKGDFVIPSFVKSIGKSAFEHCSGLTSVTIPNSVTSIKEKAFWVCEGLTSISIPNSVTKIGTSAFEFCSGLTNVEISNGVKKIGGWAFGACYQIESVYIPASVTEIGESAFSCYYLEKIVVDKDNPKYDSRENSNAIICTKKGKTTLVAGCCNTRIPNSVTRIGDYAFSRASITKIDIPQSVTEIEWGAFECCSALESISIPDSVTKLSRIVFGLCHNLKNVHLPNSITEIGGNAFLGCESLTDLCVPDGVKKIDDHAFLCCYGLKTIHLPNSVRKIGKKVFGRCDKLEKIYIPNNTKKRFAKLLPDYEHLLAYHTDKEQGCKSIK